MSKELLNVTKPYYDEMSKCTELDDMYEIAMKILKIYDTYDKVKARIMEERLYKALLYQPNDDAVWIDILEGDDSKLTPIMFVSFAPQPQECFLTCFQAVERYFERLSKITTATFVVEQREDDYEQLGKGFHFHILLTHTYSKLSDFKRDTRRCFQPYCMVERSAILNFRSNKTDQDVQNRLQYILGKKANPDKHAKQEGDIAFRKKMNLQPYYTYNGGVIA